VLRERATSRQLAPAVLERTTGFEPATLTLPMRLDLPRETAEQRRRRTGSQVCGLLRSPASQSLLAKRWRTLGAMLLTVSRA
jgi:hypothetical protein